MNFPPQHQEQHPGFEHSLVQIHLLDARDNLLNVRVPMYSLHQRLHLILQDKRFILTVEKL